jgi:hypothetical protein
MENMVRLNMMLPMALEAHDVVESHNEVEATQGAIRHYHYYYYH